MTEIKGHKKIKEAKRKGIPWSRRYIPSHHSGNCPFCSFKGDNLEAHIKTKHKEQKPRKLTGKKHGPS